MKKTSQDSPLNQDFKAFQAESPVSPPSHLYHRILDRVNEDLMLSPWEIFAKLSLVHFLTGIVTLMACPQFGVKIFSESMGLMSFFQIFGTYGCMVACGFFFLGSSILVANLFLKPGEIRVIRRNRVLQLGGLTFLSLGFFLMADPGILLGFALSWTVGSFGGGVALLELGWFFRKKVLIRTSH